MADRTDDPAYVETRRRLQSRRIQERLFHLAHAPAQSEETRFLLGLDLSELALRARRKDA